MAEIVPYNTGGTLYFPLLGSATLALSTAASGSLSGTNIVLSKDGGAFASSTNTGTIVGSGWYRWVYTTSEMSAAQIMVKIAGGTLGTTVEEQNFLFRTYGNASAYYESNVLGTAMSAQTIGTVSAVLTGTVSTVTSPVGTVSTVLVAQSATVVGTPAVNVTEAKGTAIAGTQGTLIVVAASGSVATITSPGTYNANLVSVLGTGVVATSGTLTNIGTAGTVLGTITASGTVTASTVLATVVANVTQLKGTAIAGTEGTPFARATTLTNIGNISTLASGTFDANLVQILGTAVVATSGTLTNVGTAGTALGTITASGTVTASTVLATVVANVTQLKGTAIAGTQGTVRAVAVGGSVATVTSPIGTVSTVLVAQSATVVGTPAVNVTQVKGTAPGGTQGTLEVDVVSLTTNQATLAGVPAASTSMAVMVSWMYNFSRNQLDQTTGSQVVYNDGGTAIATGTVSDDGGSYRRGEFA